MTYSEAIVVVRGKRNSDRRKVGNNTYAEILSDGSVGIKLHNTYVVKIHEDGTYTLNSGGWNTSTTKEDRKSTRLNSSHVSESRMPSSA